jgi:hypothetical protein
MFFWLRLPAAVTSPLSTNLTVANLGRSQIGLRLIVQRLNLHNTEHVTSTGIHHLH